MPTKQEEIEGWINKYLTKQFICNPDELPDDECLAEAKAVLAYLHSRGCVLKMDKELPCDQICSHAECEYRLMYVSKDYQEKALAGYVAVEPLVEK